MISDVVVMSGTTLGCTSVCMIFWKTNAMLLPPPSTPTTTWLPRNDCLQLSTVVTLVSNYSGYSLMRAPVAVSSLSCVLYSAQPPANNRVSDIITGHFTSHNTCTDCIVAAWLIRWQRCKCLWIHHHHHEFFTRSHRQPCCAKCKSGIVLQVVSCLSIVSPRKK